MIVKCRIADIKDQIKRLTYKKLFVEAMKMLENENWSFIKTSYNGVADR